MGIVSTTLSQSNNMKFLLVLAAAAYARAEAEAKPGFVYTTGHLPLAYGYPYAVHHPLVYTAPVGCQNNEGAAVPWPMATPTPSTIPWSTLPLSAARTTRVLPSPAPTEFSPTAWSLPCPPPLLRRRQWSP